MDINDLTVAQVKEILQLFGPTILGQTKDYDNGLIGEYVLVRCRDAGVWAGTLKFHNGRECVLENGRRCYKWHTDTENATLTGLATNGPCANSLIAAPIYVHLTENCEIMKTSAIAQEKFKDWPVCKK